MTEDLVCLICTQTAKCKNRKWWAISWPDSLTSQRPHSKVSIWCEIYHVLCTDLLSTTLDHVPNQCSLLHCWYLRPYFWSPFENYSQTLSLKHTLLPLDWIPALLVTLPASHSCPTQSSLGYVCQGQNGVCLLRDSPVGLQRPPSSWLYYLHLFPVSEPQLQQNNSGAFGKSISLI